MTAACEEHGTACTPDRPVTIPGHDECAGPWGTQCPWPEGHDSTLAAVEVGKVRLMELDNSAGPPFRRVKPYGSDGPLFYRCGADARTGPADRRDGTDGFHCPDWEDNPDHESTRVLSPGRRSTDKDDT